MSSHPASLKWALEFLPHYFTQPPADFHADLMRDLESPAKKRIARVAPRGHAKSTCAALAYPLWAICEKKARNILILTHESSLARQFVRDIRTELESNDRIRAAYGDLAAPETDQNAPRKQARKQKPPAAQRVGCVRGRRNKALKTDPLPPTSNAPSATTTPPSSPRRPKWTQDKFTTTTGVTVQAKGAGAALRGTRSGPHRPDLIICDDIEKDALVDSQDARRKLENWLRRVVMPALDPAGKLVVVGSIIHHDSLLSTLRDARRFPGWDYRVYRAIEARPHPSPDPAAGMLFELSALWPDRWPLERLEQERERIGSAAFEQEYQANPVDSDTRVFRPDWIVAAPHDQLDALVRADRLYGLMAVDPATGTAGGDFFALWVGGVDTQTGIIHTRELLLERIGVVDQIRRILECFHRYRPAQIGIEATAYQVVLKDFLVEEGRRRGDYLPLVAIQTTANKRARIESVAPLLENGTFRLPPTLSPEAELQFLQFPKARHDDAPDVCAMAIELARSVRGAGGPVGFMSPRAAGNGRHWSVTREPRGPGGTDFWGRVRGPRFDRPGAW